MLTERAKQLIPKARIVSLANWEQIYPSATIALFQAADDEGRYPSDTDLEALVATFQDFPEPSKAAALARVGARPAKGNRPARDAGPWR